MTGPHDLVERDERDVDDGEIDRLGECRRREPAGVRALERRHTVVAAQRFGELTATHVESVDVARAALQQHVGEAAGRRTDVERRHPGRVDPELVERSRELVAAAAHVWLGALDVYGGFGIDGVAGLEVASRSVAIADTDLAGEDQGLALAPGLGEPAVDEQLIESHTSLPADGRSHDRIVA